MKTSTFLQLLFCISFLLFSCDESGEQDDNETDSGISTQSEENSADNDAEKYVAEVDSADYVSGKSLSYSKPNGASIAVEFWLNDSNQVVKMIEYSAKANGGTIDKKYFYYKDNKKYVTKEYFDDSKGDKSGYVERISYYKNGRPAITKMRRADFEDYLEFESFKVVEPKDCSDQKAYDVLNQTSEYSTTFQGFVYDEHMTYLLVGPNTKDGYVSSLSVQFKTGVIRKLMENERAYIGTPLIVNFETAISEIGFEFQVLTSVEFAGKP